MKLKVINQHYNPLLKRKEVVFEAEHGQHEGTLPRAELRKNLSEILKENVDLVFVQRAVTKTGSMLTVGEANVYDTVNQAKLVEAKHIFERNVPSAKPAPEEAAKPKEPAPPQPPREEKAKPKEEGEKKPKEA